MLKQKKPTVADIAQATQLSKTTISNFLNQKYDSISAETRIRIEDAIQQMGYVCNKNYHRSKNTKQIGLIVTDLTDPFIATLCKGVNDACTKHGYDVLIANTDNNPTLEKRYIKAFSNKTDGLILNTSGIDEESLEIIGMRIPVVLADRYLHPPIFDVISSNNYEAVMELMKYLYDMNYNCFGLFSEALLPGTARKIRHKAFHDFAAQYQGRGLFESYIISLYDDKELTLRVIDFISKSGGRKRVMIGVNGRTLLRILSVLSALELKVPDDIGVCGYDDFDWAHLINGGITTVQQPTYDIGYECVERLLKRIAKEKLPVQQILLRSRLMLRGSLK